VPKVAFIVSPYYFSSQKRLFDVFFTLLILIISLPILLIIGLVIFIDSGLPIVFKQKRKGQLEQPFTLYKLRTMKLHSHASKKELYKHNQAPYPMFKMTNDPRYTSIGKMLSRSGLDELPQLLNILKGEMSWVGPRPLPIEEAKLLGKDWDFRYLVKPGILSEWAVNSSRYESLKKWKQLEVETLEKGSLKNDIQLIFRTLRYLTALNS
jgi:lipopolysaccharide/colanic/teichoic acid biosynthesis glycosyltransferase